MNNIFLSKTRIAFIFSTVLINIILILLGNNSSRGNNFVAVIINIIIISFIVIQVFYNPYKYVFFDNNENIENLYFYFYIIDHIKNDSYILEEKLKEHYERCKSCELCQKLKKHLTNKFDNKKLYKILYKYNAILSKIINELIFAILMDMILLKIIHIF